MNKSPKAATLAMPRRFAIRLLHQAQIAGDQPFSGVVGAHPDPGPDSYLPLNDSGVSGLAEAFEALGKRQRQPWAVYLHRPGQPTAPTAEDFVEYAQTPRLTSSLATKGVLQLRAWVLEDGRVVERVLQLSD